MSPGSIFEEAYGRPDADSAGAAGGGTLSGTVEEIIYAREDTGFVILSLEGDDGGLHSVLGVMPDVTEGDLLRLRGRWENNARYGRQFRVLEYERELPSDVAAIERYLSSGAIRGIRLKTAHKIVAQFGEDTFDVIENHPEWLADNGKAGAGNIRGVQKAVGYARHGNVLPRLFRSRADHADI